MDIELSDFFAPRQREFIENSTAPFNLAHGSVRSGKTVCTVFRFLQAVYQCPGTQIWLIGHSLKTVYDNIIRLILESEQLKFFSHFCTWQPGKHRLVFAGKYISCLGAKDERALGPIQGKTFDLCYCDEITLYPENVIQMIDTRLSNPHSMLFASMNPVQPSHIVKKWIDAGEAGDKKFYSLHFSIDDNPFLPDDYKARLRQTLTGLFYRRNYLGEWCLAEGAIFDFIEKGIHIVPRLERNPDYYIAAIDYGASNPFACVLLAYSSGRFDGTGPHLTVVREFYYDPKVTRQKTNADFGRDMEEFLDGYPLHAIYIDPSAASFKVEMKRRGFTVFDADNDVYNGIMSMTNLLKEGALTICSACKNLIREMEGYVWDPAKSARGIDAPLKKDDHAIDALRYAVKSFLKGKVHLRKPLEQTEELGRSLGTQKPASIQFPSSSFY